MLNLLNLGVGGQAQIQAPALATSAQLGGRLAGLRQTTGTFGGFTSEMNPFVKSLQTSAGSSLGSWLGPSGYTAAAGSSSIKYKENIKQSTVDSIQVLKDTDLYEFNYKPELNDSKDRIGIIAEEAPEILTVDNRDKFDMYNALGVLMDSSKKIINRLEKLEDKVV